MYICVCGIFCVPSTSSPFYNLFSVGLGSPPAFPFEAKSQLASSPASKVRSRPAEYMQAE